MTPRSIVLLGFAMVVAAGLPLWALAGGATSEGAGPEGARQGAAGAIERRYLAAASDFHRPNGSSEAHHSKKRAACLRPGNCARVTRAGLDDRLRR